MIFLLVGWVIGSVTWAAIATRESRAHARAVKEWGVERSLLLDRLMARSFEQFKAQSEPDDYLAAHPFKPRRVLYDETGLLEVDLDDDEGVTSGDRQA